MTLHTLGSVSRSILVIALVSAMGIVGALPAGSSGTLARSARGDEWRREPGGAKSALSAVTVNHTGKIFVAGSVRARPVMPGTNVHVDAMLVAKYDRHGRLAWRETWRRSGLWFAHGEAVAPAPAGGVYVAGISGRYEGWSPVLWRYSASGRLLWHRTLPSPLGRADMRSIAADADGVVAAVHNSETGGPTAGGSFVYAFDHSGRVTWRTEFAVPGITGTMNGVNGVAIGDDGRIYAAGFVSRSQLDAQWQDWDAVVQQLDRDGHVGWTRVVADPGVRDYDVAQAVDVAGGLVIAAGSTDNWTHGGVWAFTLDGQRRWVSSWGRRYQTTSPALTIASWGAIYVAAVRSVYGPGSTTSTTASLRQYEPDGTFVSSRAAAAYVAGVATADAIYVVSGPALERWLP